MHSCPECGMACDCDGEDLWHDWPLNLNCRHECEDDEDEIPPHHGRFELRVDEDTGRRYWWGAEDGWKDPTEIGESGVLIIDAQHFAVGTVLTLTEPLDDNAKGQDE